MKTIIAGSRTITNWETVKNAIEWSGFEITEVVSGHANGVDLIGEKWARLNKIPVKTFPVKKADWDKFGKAAGPIRNRRMAEYGEQLIAIQKGGSGGTQNMVEEAKKRGLPVFLFVV
jgi:hypothetical protein